MKRVQDGTDSTIPTDPSPSKPAIVNIQFSADLVHLNGDALIVLAGELDMATAPDLSSLLDPLVESGPPELILDFSGLSFIDSSGLAVLTNAERRLREQGRTLRIRSLRPSALKVFEIAGLMDVLNVAVGQDPSSD
jgi:anti-sigma B factor antagonist